GGAVKRDEAAALRDPVDERALELLRERRPVGIDDQDVVLREDLRAQILQAVRIGEGHPPRLEDGDELLRSVERTVMTVVAEEEDGKLLELGRLHGAASGGSDAKRRQKKDGEKDPLHGGSSPQSTRSPVGFSSPAPKNPPRWVSGPDRSGTDTRTGGNGGPGHPEPSSPRRAILCQGEASGNAEMSWAGGGERQGQRKKKGQRQRQGQGQRQRQRQRQGQGQ